MIFNLFRRKNSEQNVVVIVSGLPRSGTSMMMKMLEAGGLTVLTDYQRTADENNPKGYYEFERVKKLKDGDTLWVAEARGKVVKVITALLEYLPPTESYRVVLMRRDMNEILASQRRMLQRDGKPEDEVDDNVLADLYKKHLEKVSSWLSQQNNIQTLFISYNDIIANPRKYVEDINYFLGGNLNINAMMGIIDQNLYRERGS